MKKGVGCRSCVSFSQTLQKLGSTGWQVHSTSQSGLYILNKDTHKKWIYGPMGSFYRTGNLKNKIKLPILIALSLFTTSCISVPKEVIDSGSACQLSTHQYELIIVGSDKPYFEALEEKQKSLPSCGTPGPIGSICASLLAGYVSVSAVSLVVSGSIVITGNTVHWIEKQGKCEDSQVQNFKENFTNSMLETGGWLVVKADQLLSWSTKASGKSIEKSKN